MNGFGKSFYCIVKNGEAYSIWTFKKFVESDQSWKLVDGLFASKKDAKLALDQITNFELN